MKTFSALLAASSLVSLASAQDPRVVSWDITRGNVAMAAQLRKRATFTETLINNITGQSYYASITVGTPPQNLTVVLDTGSSDLWVLSNKADLCTNPRLQAYYGEGCVTPYDPTSSSSYQSGTTAFSIQYVDGTGAKGTYIHETVSVGGAKVTGLQMGLATTTEINSGLLGIGYAANEAARTIYPNIMDVMVSQGVIAVKAYSLWLNDLQSTSGTILFGGIDTEKYQGSLIAVPIQPDSQSKQITSFTVALTSIVADFANGTTTNFSKAAIPAVLDSGTTLTYLPSATAARIYAALGAVDDTGSSGTGLVYIDCGLLSTKMTMDFQFGGSSGPTVKVPIDEFVLDDVGAYIELGLQPPSLPFTNICSFGLQPSSNYYLLGDTFLRSAYVVYDLANNQLAIAQTVFNATASNVVEITSNTTLPDVSGIASGAAVSQTATGLPGGGTGGRTSSGTSLPTVTVTVGTDGTTASSTSTHNAGVKAVPDAPGVEAMAFATVVGICCLLGGMLIIV